MRELVDDDVGVAVARDASSWRRPSTISQIDVEPVAGRDHVLRALSAPRRGRVDDDRACASRRRRRARSSRGRSRAGSPSPPGPSGSRRSCRRSRRPPSCRSASCGGRLAADVGPEVVEHRLLARAPEDRKLERLRDERQTEVEVEDIRARQEPRRARATASPGDGGSRRAGRATGRPQGGACSARRRRDARRPRDGGAPGRSSTARPQC